MKHNTSVAKYFQNIDWNKVVRLATFFLLAVVILFSFLNFFSLTFNPYPDDYADGIIVNFANTLLEKGTYFLDIHNYPYIHAAYPPIFILLAAGFFKIFGSSFFILRFLSLIFSLVIAFIIFNFLKSSTKNKFLPLYFTGLCFVPKFMSEWLAVGRVDTLAILFTILGLIYYLKDQKKLVLPIIFFTLAFFTKQTSILGAGAVFLDLFLNKKNRKTAWVFALYLGLSILSIFSVLTLYTKGQFFLHLITYTKAATIELPVLITKYVRFFRPLAILTAFALYFLIKNKRNVLGIYFILNVLFLVTAGKDGASSNYFIEPFISLLLFCGLQINEFFKKSKKETLLITLLLFFQIIALLSNPRYYLNIVQKTISPNYQAQQKVSTLIKNTKEPILSEDIGYLTMNDKKVWLQPFQFMKMAKANIWNPQQLLNDCYRKKFKLIFAGERIKAIPGMNNCLKQTYKKIGAFQDMDIYQ